MFDALSERLQGVFDTLRGQTRITDEVLDKTLREIRMALLEADVHVGVVRALLDGVRAKAKDEEVAKSFTPGQQVVKIVRDELEALLGGPEAKQLQFRSQPPTVIFLVGLQGSGKTTTAAKLGLWLKKAGKYPYLVPADVDRPAAIEQLVRIGTAAGLKVHAHDGKRRPLPIAREALDEARLRGYDTVLVDTAGRLHIDAALMAELAELKTALSPQEILFVADAMTGQDAVKSAGEFHRALALTGVILTKMDGDARGGAALSIRHVTGLPIKFVGTGERPSEFDAFYPDRMVGRILGMGDILGLIEKAEEAVDLAQAKEMERKLRKNEFTLQDFRDQIRTLQKMGPLSGILGMLPGMGALKNADLDDGALKGVLALIDSMTPEERRRPEILNGSRKKRVSRGSGRPVQEINRLLKQFAQMRKVMKQVQAARSGRPGFKLPFLGR
ncbi:MAG TPA: signal recognition particle protein [Candidatus Polarisedimenticolaceae bacterium]|nr:signal recognition particle protein [Candidatus Polarisedimenticolaceae bacterium]